MIGKTIFILFGLLALSYCQLDVDLSGLGDIIKNGARLNITSDVQGLLSQMNGFVTAKGMASVKLPDVRCRRKTEPVFSGVTFQGLNKMTKTLRADATITGSNSLKVCTTLVFKNVKLDAEQSTLAQSELSWDIGSMTMDINLSMLPKKNGENKCYTRFNRIRILDLSNIVQRSSNAEFDGKVPETQVVDKVIRYYNQYLRNPRVLRRLGSTLDICEPSSNTITEAVSVAIETIPQE